MLNIAQKMKFSINLVNVTKSAKTLAMKTTVFTLCRYSLTLDYSKQNILACLSRNRRSFKWCSVLLFYLYLLHSRVISWKHNTSNRITSLL